MNHLKISANPHGRDFAISDINGCLPDLQLLLSEVDFTSSDRLFVVGNSINHGLYNLETIDFLCQSNIFPLLGHAELLMLLSLTESLDEDDKAIALEQWLENGGEWHLQVDASKLRKALKIISKWPLSITINGDRRIGLVHSECPFDDWDSFLSSPASYKLVLNATIGQTILQGDRSGEIQNADLVISGHTPLPKPPVFKGKCVYINHGIVVGKKAKLYDIADFFNDGRG